MDVDLPAKWSSGMAVPADSFLPLRVGVCIGLGAAAAVEYSANVIGAHASNSSLPTIRSLTLASPFVVLGPQALTAPYRETQVRGRRGERGRGGEVVCQCVL